MATCTMKPPLFCGSPSGAAWTASSWSRVDGIDGEEGEFAQVRAALEPRRLELLHLGQHAGRELVGDAVRVHGDQADLALVSRIAERLDDADLRHAVLVRARQLEANEVAVLGRALVTRRDRPLPQLLAVDGIDETAAGSLAAEDAEQPALVARQALDRLGLVAVAGDVAVLEPRHPRQDAIALPERGLTRPAFPARRQHKGTRALALGCVPHDGLADELSVRVARDDLEHGHRGQVPALLEALAVAAQQALLRHLGEQALEGNAVAALDGEGARDLAFPRLDPGGAHIVEYGLLARQSRLAAGVFGFAGHRRGGS